MFREYLLRKARLVRGGPARLRIGKADVFTDEPPERRALAEQCIDLIPLFIDRPDPSGTSFFGLVPPLQEVKQEYFQSTLQLATFTRSQGLDLLGDVLDICVGNLTAAQQSRLLFGPGMEVLVIEVFVGCHRITFLMDSRSRAHRWIDRLSDSSEEVLKNLRA
jgi:hypothetical protein